MSGTRAEGRVGMHWHVPTLLWDKVTLVKIEKLKDKKNGSGLKKKKDCV